MIITKQRRTLRRIVTLKQNKYNAIISFDAYLWVCERQASLHKKFPPKASEMIRASDTNRCKQPIWQHRPPPRETGWRWRGGLATPRRYVYVVFIQQRISTSGPGAPPAASRPPRILGPARRPTKRRLTAVRSPPHTRNQHKTSQPKSTPMWS